MWSTKFVKKATEAFQLTTKADVSFDWQFKFTGDNIYKFQILPSGAVLEL